MAPALMGNTSTGVTGSSVSGNALYYSALTGGPCTDGNGLSSRACAMQQFVIPGLDGFQFVAWGTAGGVVHVGYYMHESDDQGRSDPAPINVVLNLRLKSSREGLDVGPVRHVLYGGGPHALLVAATDSYLGVFRLDRLVYDILSHHYSSGSVAWMENDVESSETLYHVCSSTVMKDGVGCIVGVSWTHQLDGVLVTDSESRVQMWEVVRESSASTSLSLLWETKASEPQDLLCAGVSVLTPCVTASSIGSGSQDGVNHHNVYVWWCNGGHGVRAEALKHPSKVVHVEWSPGVLRKDILEEPVDVQEGEGEEVSTSRRYENTPEDHPAIMTLDEEGCVRVWVEMLVVHDVPPSSQKASQCDSYFAMNLMIQQHGLGSHQGFSIEHGGKTAHQKTTFCTWVKPMDSMMSQSRHVSGIDQGKFPILWLIVGSSFYLNEQRNNNNNGGKCLLKLYALRGLAPVVVSSFQAGPMTLGQGTTPSSKPAKKPQVVLWGEHIWDPSLESFDIGACYGTLAQSLCTALMMYGDDFPRVTIFGMACKDSHTISCSGISLVTCMKESLPNSPSSIQQSLYSSHSWKGFARMHAHPISSLCVMKKYVVSIDTKGCLIVWEIMSSNESLRYHGSINLSFEMDQAFVHDIGTMKSGLSGIPMDCCVVLSSTMVYFIGITPSPGDVRLFRQHASQIDNVSSSHIIMYQGVLGIVSLGQTANHIVSTSMVFDEEGNTIRKVKNHHSLALEHDEKVIHSQSFGKGHVSPSVICIGTSRGQIFLLDIKSISSSGILFSERISSSLECGEVSLIEYHETYGYLAAQSKDRNSLHMFKVSKGCDKMSFLPCGSISFFSNFVSIAWMKDEILPCIAIANNRGQIGVFSLDNRGFDCWNMLASFTGAHPNSRFRLCYSASNLFGVVENSVRLIGRSILDSQHSVAELLPRSLLLASGSLPQYHPRMLYALLLGGNIETFFLVLQSFASWLDDREDFSRNDSLDSDMPKNSLDTNFQLDDGTRCPYPAVSLSNFVSQKQKGILEVLRKVQEPEVERALPAPAPHPSPSHETGMLDLSAFGMTAAPAPAPQPSPSYETGMLDMSAFGMTAAPAPAIPEPVSFPQPQTEAPRHGVANTITLSEPEKITYSTCQDYLKIVKDILSKTELWKVSKWDEDDANASIGLCKEDAIILERSLKQSEEILSVILRDIHHPLLVYLLSISWSTASVIGERKVVHDQSESLLRQNKFIANAAGVHWDFGQTDGFNDSSNQSMEHRFGLSDMVNLESLAWLCLSTCHSSAYALEYMDKINLFSTKTNDKDDRRGFLSTYSEKKTDTWATWRSAGIAFWLHDKDQLKQLLEDMAKATFRDSRDPDLVALFYVAIGKASVLRGLYKTCNRLKESEFLSRDFTRENNQQAACKNGFVLLGQHRYQLAAAFFILGGKYHDAVDICLQKLEDIQLAIIISRTLGLSSQKLQSTLEPYFAPYRHVTSVCFFEQWMAGNTSGALKCLMDVREPSDSVWTVVYLLNLILFVPKTDIDPDTFPTGLHRSSTICADILRRNGLSSLSIQLELIASKFSGGNVYERWKHEVSNACALAMLETPLSCIPKLASDDYFTERIQYYIQQLEQMQSLGVEVSSNTVLHRIEYIYQIVASSASIITPGTPKSFECGISLGRTHSMDSQSIHSASSMRRGSLDETQELAKLVTRSRKLTSSDDAPAQIVYPKGVEIFRVDGDSLFSVCSCPLLAPDVCGRLVAVSTPKHGILEFATHADVEVPGDMRGDKYYTSVEAHASFNQEAPRNYESPRRGGVFSRFVSQIFDQASWLTDPLEDSSPMIDGDVGLAVTSSMSSASSAALRTTTETPYTTPLADAKTTFSKMLVSHPHRQLFLSGCKDTGRIKLWQYDGPRPLRLFTPVPYHDLKQIKKSTEMFSFSSKLARSHSLTSRMGHWGKAVDISFSDNGERFASIGEGGVVAVWRLSSGFNKHADVDGATCSEWWQTCLTHKGRSVAFVGGGSVVVAAAGSCDKGNISLWNTSDQGDACIARLKHHKAPVNRIKTLPGGWLLAAADDLGHLSVSDIRMLGSTDKSSLIWHIKACKGTIRALDTITVDSNALTGSTTAARITPLALGYGLDSGIVSGGDDGIIRIWNVINGSLIQETTRVYAETPRTNRLLSLASGGDPKYSITDLAVCEEGIISSGTDGVVRLYPKL